MSKMIYFGKDIEPRCEYCSYGRRSTKGENILCEKQGVVEEHYHCKKFSYDPLKRVPKRANKLPSFDVADFML